MTKREMKGIIPPKISIDEFRVESLNLGKKFIDTSFSYTVSIENLSTKDKIKRRFFFSDKIISFILTAIEDLKRIAGIESAKIENEENIKEKLVNIFNRLMLEIKDLEKIKDHEKYMKAYNKINCYKAVF